MCVSPKNTMLRHVSKGVILQHANQTPFETCLKRVYLGVPQIKPYLSHGSPIVIQLKAHQTLVEPWLNMVYIGETHIHIPLPLNCLVKPIYQCNYVFLFFTPLGKSSDCLSPKQQCLVQVIQCEPPVCSQRVYSLYYCSVGEKSTFD